MSPKGEKTLPRRPPPRGPLRLEGMVYHSRISKIVRTRYLVLDFHEGSISLYKRPPNRAGNEDDEEDDEDDVSPTRAKSMPSKILTSMVKSLPSVKRSASQGRTSLRSSFNGESGGSQVDVENLAHISKEPMESSMSLKWKVPSSVNWKIRDVENDETMFYLILPTDYKTDDPEAEVYEVAQLGRQMTYRSLNAADDEMSPLFQQKPSIDSLAAIKEGEVNTNHDATNDSTENGTAVTDDDDTQSLSSAGSSAKLPKRFRLSRSIKRKNNEVVYQFRVLLDGNEKFIWLQAAAEMDRLADETAVSLANKIDVTKTIRSTLSTGGKDSQVRLRYAEWARLVDSNKSVSNLEFDVRDEGARKVQQSTRNFDADHLLRIIPTYAYRNRRMSEKDLYYEMMQTSEKWEDFRGKNVGDRDEPMIGSLHVEVLACHGLPKLDTFSLTDAVCYFVCGPFAFATDVIDGFKSPVWPCKSRRACIFPIFYAYSKLSVGVFDDDGAGANDDFAGRVVIEVARLRPNTSYDIFLPLRQYQNAYIREARGVVHLRLRLEWEDERKAVLSYLKLPQKTEALGNAITVNCADLKAFRNVVLTVQGKDVPGRYKQFVMKGLQREMKLYKIAIKTSMKEIMMDIVFWVNPLTSLTIFTAWMHCVYANSMSMVPVYIVSGLIVLLVHNYFEFATGEAYNARFAPITISELIMCLLFGGPKSKYIKPIEVSRQCYRGNKQNQRENDHEDLMRHSSRVMKGEGIPVDGDHVEFPFSEQGRYAKKTLAESCVDASAMKIENGGNEVSTPGSFASRKWKRQKKLVKFIRSNTYEDDYGEDEDEFEITDPLLDKTHKIGSKIGHEVEKIEHELEKIGHDVHDVAKSRTHAQTVKDLVDVDAAFSMPDVKLECDPVVAPDKPWKRVKEPLPEQDAKVAVKAKKTLKEEIIHNKNLLHKVTMRMFDDRIFILDENDPGFSISEEATLNNAIGTYKHKNPVITKLAEYMGPMQEVLKLGLSVWRSLFNLFTWQDPYLSFLFLLGAFFLLCVLIIFPWRIFFFATGFGITGPQNLCLRLFRDKYKNKSKTKKVGTDAKKKGRKSKPNAVLGNITNIGSLTPPRNNIQDKKQSQMAGDFQFHNHLVTNGGSDLRDERATKYYHRAVVPTSPLISRRFYDWPPNPSLSKADIHQE